MTGISPLAQLALAAGMLLLGLALNRAGARRAVVDAVGRHRL
jgi:hypothetical protein